MSSNTLSGNRRLSFAKFDLTPFILQAWRISRVIKNLLRQPRLLNPPSGILTMASFK
jgi:hypothetical protein